MTPEQARMEFVDYLERLSRKTYPIIHGLELQRAAQYIRELAQEVRELKAQVEAAR